MKISSKLYTLLFVPLAVLGFTACDEPPEVAYPGGNTFGYQGQGQGPGPAPTGPNYGAAYGQGAPPSGPAPGADSDARPGPGNNPPPSNNNTARNDAPARDTPPSGPAGTPSYPKGIPVPGKPGFVMSPYTKPDQGYVDVRGYPPGMEVKDPYTGGVFLVP
jgi:hypothetical protein